MAPQRSRHVSSLMLMFLILAPPAAFGHGSVTADEDLCVIDIGYFKAHFKVYLTETEGHKDFCEDLPEAGNAVFVMEYMHGDLSSAAMDLRIVRNVTGLGRFARLADVDKIPDLDAATVFYRPPAQEADVFLALHRFEQPGEYLGLVTATDPETGQIHSAVFPFQVGHVGYGTLPCFLLALLLVHGLYVVASRRNHRQHREAGGNHA